MKAILIAIALAAIPIQAKADMVGAVFGASAGIVAGPPGIIIGAIIGGLFGKPFWFNAPPGACWIDNRFRRHCGGRSHAQR